MSSVVYFWFGLGLLLIVAEMIAPGVFLLWIGTAALAMGGVMLLLPDLSALAQSVLFAVMAAIAIQVYRVWLRKHERQSDQPLLNRKVDQMIGRSFALDQPIENGSGKVRIGDALWSVQGPDAPAGTRVTVTGTDGLVLRVSVET